MKPNYSVFYSWQSDLSKNTNLIALRHALREAANQVEKEIDDLKIDIDEATRDVAGSPNIPQIIFSKIEASDIFVCDLTTINNDTDDTRKLPNPNVLIELGFAVATIGWNRIILLFNKSFGNFPDDLPFDIDRHRATPFSISDKNDNNGKKQIASVLKEAIKKIIEKEPLKPDELKKITPEQRKREIDIKNLKLAFSAIHTPSFDHFIEEFPTRIPQRIFFFRDCFTSIVDSSSFFIYDQELSNKINNLKTNWDISLSYGQHYNTEGASRYYDFYTPMDLFPSEQAEKDFNFLVKLRDDLFNNFKDLIVYIRQNFLEIDIDETNRNAFESYKTAFERE